MKFGSVDMFVDLGEWGYRMGRPVANEGFLKALLTYGTYDEYEFFCPDTFHMERFSKRIQEIVNDPLKQSRVKSSLQIALSESIRYRQYDVFHMGDFTYFMPYLVGIRNRFAQNLFPITGVTHSLDAIYMNLRYLELIYAGLAPFDGIICTSRAAKQCVENGLNRVLERMSEQMNVPSRLQAGFKQIPLGIDDAFFHQTDKASARAYFNIPDKAVLALSIGRFSLRQKCDWSPVLELLARMCTNKNMKNFILLIAGGADESDISLLETLISRYGLDEKVLLLPNFSTDIKTKLYKAADFYISVVDNFQETFGLNVVEAMASGLPVIASDFSGYRELVDHNKNGFLIPTLWSPELPEFIHENLGILDPSLAKFYLSQTVAIDLEQLQHAIEMLYQNDSLRKTMSVESVTRAQKYQWKNVIRLYEDFWAELAEDVLKVNRTMLKTNQDILVGDFGRTFAHYPSHIMSENDLFSITRVGQDAMNSHMPYLKYEDLSVCLFPELETLILAMLQEGNQSLQAIKKYAEHRLQATHGQTLFHLGWLLKHGAVKIKNPDREDSARLHPIGV